MKINPLGLTAKVCLIVKHRILMGVYPSGEKIPRVEELAEEFGVNLNTVKHALKKLKEEGLVEPVRKAGTRVSAAIVPEKKDVYMRQYQKMSLIIEEMVSAGFSALDIFSCFSGAVESLSDGEGIYYVDASTQAIVEGKRELEELLGVKVHPILADELEPVARMKKLDVPGNVVVTTFLLEERVRSCLRQPYVIPLKTTPPVDQLCDFRDVPPGVPVYVVGNDGREKDEWKELYAHLREKNGRIHFVSIEELETGNAKVEPGGVFIISRYIYGRVEKFLRSARQVIAFGKFTDPDGMQYIREALLGGRK